jgi:TetR/AcrR family transcriptional regulator
MHTKDGKRSYRSGTGQAEALESSPRRSQTTDLRGGRVRDANLTRSKILDAAKTEFADKGLDARIEDIASIAGANRRMAYFYFGSKEGLYLASLESVISELTEAELAINVDSLPPLEAIKALVEAKFEHFKKYPHFIDFIRLENANRGRSIVSSDRLSEFRAPMVDILGRILRRGELDGSIVPGILSLDLYVVISGISYFSYSNQYTLKAIFGADPTSEETISRQRSMIVDMLKTYLERGPRSNANP